MASLNKVFIMGNLTREPEVRHTPSGSAVCDLGLAVNRKYMANNQEQEEVCFVDVIVWGKQAESCGRYLEKGSPALIEGRLQLDQWQDKNSGASRSRLRVVAERVQFMPRSGERRDNGSGNAYNSYNAGDQQRQSYGNNASQSGQGYYKPPVPPQGGGLNGNAVSPQNGAQAQPPKMPDGAFDVGQGAEDDIPF